MHNELKLNGTTICTDDNIYGGVSYVHSIDNGSDIEYGITAMATIEFVTSVSTLAVGNELVWRCKMIGQASFANKGYFIIKSVERYKTKYKVYAEDRMSKFEVNADAWLASLTFPISLYDMLTSLCTYCGVTLGVPEITNGAFGVPAAFTAKNLNARSMLQYIAAVSGSYAVIEYGGTLVFKNVTASGVSLTNAQFRTFTHADYITDVITKVQARITDKDIGVSYGVSDDNIYVIQDNPLFYDNAENNILPVVTAIYDKIKTVSYVPATITVGAVLPIISIGDLITVTDYPVLISEYRINASGVTLSSSGNKKRDFKSTTAQQQFERLAGRTFSLETSVDGLFLEVTDLDDYVHSLTLEVTASDMTAAVTTAAGGSTMAVFDADGITCYNGGFRIRSGTPTSYTEVMTMSSSGNLTLTGSIFQPYMNGKNMWLNAGKILWVDGTSTSAALNAMLSYETAQGNYAASLQLFSLYDIKIYGDKLYLSSYDTYVTCSDMGLFNVHNMSDTAFFQVNFSTSGGVANTNVMLTGRSNTIVANDSVGTFLITTLGYLQLSSGSQKQITLVSGGSIMMTMTTTNNTSGTLGLSYDSLNGVTVSSLSDSMRLSYNGSFKINNYNIYFSGGYVRYS